MLCCLDIAYYCGGLTAFEIPFVIDQSSPIGLAVVSIHGSRGSSMRKKRVTRTLGLPVTTKPVAVLLVLHIDKEPAKSK